MVYSLRKDQGPETRGYPSGKHQGLKTREYPLRTDRHLRKHNLPVVLRTRAIKLKNEIEKNILSYMSISFVRSICFLQHRQYRKQETNTTGTRHETIITDSNHTEINTRNGGLSLLGKIYTISCVAFW